jgi:hypothetical protein
MPVRDLFKGIVSFPLAKGGIALNKSLFDIGPNEARQSQNCFWSVGIKKRGGSFKFEDDEVSAGNPIRGLYRFYYSINSRQLLVSSGTTVKYHDGATWQNVKTGLTDGLQTHFATWLESVYIANGTDAPHKWDGSADTAVGAAPADTKMFLPYADRLLSITGGDLTWSSGSYDDTSWETIAACGVRPDSQLFGMTIHSATETDTGQNAKVLLAGSSGMYLFSGTNLTTPFTSGDYTLQTLSTNVGCNAPRTMQWTPKGTIYLGVDRQIYLLPFNSLTPLPIGHKITSVQNDINGLEDIPAAQVENACAVYHDGFYKLSFALSGSAVNTVQYWLDVDRLQEDEDNFIGPWYGPMKGQNIAVFAKQSGNGDIGQLMGGEDDGTIGSFVYEVGDDTTFSDVGTAIDVKYQTFYNPLSQEAFNKVLTQMEFELLDITSSVTVNFSDTDGIVRTSAAIPLSGVAIFWDDAYWGEEYWSSSAPTRVPLSLSSLAVRTLSLTVDNSSSNESFELYGINVEVTERSKPFR